MNPEQDTLKVALLPDFAEELWPSMDLVFDQIRSQLEAGHAPAISTRVLRPPYRRRLARLPGLGAKPPARNFDRLINRFYDYPKHLAQSHRGSPADVYHIVDHSYAQLAHALPSNRVVITCHDLDTFRSVLDPARDPRPYWFRAMMKRTLAGFVKAAAIVCVSSTVRDELVATGLVAGERVSVVPNGTDPSCTPSPDPQADAQAAELLAGAGPGPLVLHVGSNIKRKRIDVLLDVFAGLVRVFPHARLIRVGGGLTGEQYAQADRLNVKGGLIELPFLDRSVLAAIYRRADLVLQPSEAEGFGLPVAEAQACGTIVLASDIPVLREVGGDATLYAPVAAVEPWIEQAALLLKLPPEEREPLRLAGIANAARFSWTEHIRGLVAIYREIASTW